MGSRVLVLVMLVGACGRFSFDPEGDDYPTTESDPMMSALVAHWSFDQNALDDVWGDHVAECVGTCPDMIRAGVNGNGLQLDGTQCLHVPSLDDWNPSEFTLSAWVQNAAPTGAVIAHEFSGGCPSQALELTGGAVGLVQLNESDEHNEAWMAMAPTAGWHQVAVRWDGTSQEVYVDGVCQCGARPSLRPVSAVTAAFNVGCYPQGGLSFEGRLDDVRVYDRALEPGEVASLYAVGDRTAPVPVSCAQTCSALP